MVIKKFIKATEDFFKYKSTNPTDYTQQQAVVELMQNNNEVLESLVQLLLWQPDKPVVLGQLVCSPNMGANIVAVVTKAGRTNTVEPTWRGIGETTYDGNVTYVMQKFSTLDTKTRLKVW